jgi:ABC-type lipoprotein release transport system permease subunit
MTPFSIFVGLRYTQARRRSGFVSFIVLSVIYEWLPK